MRYQVGTRGQIVIAKALRDQLGVKPGWVALQRLVDDHVEIRFIAPEGDRSLFGVLASYARDGEDDWESVRGVVWRAVGERSQDENA